MFILWLRVGVFVVVEFLGAFPIVVFLGVLGIVNPAIIIVLDLQLSCMRVFKCFEIIDIMQRLYSLFSQSMFA
ncbi:uncharacterized protein BXZ73DRAFT_108091 [Epithele typhae]|uniref:uncharacterized protein n=1 Tax=Epithele typhae TaxID=378194 RepID=UPI002007A3E8|nr:uncharacterized protein BXZ73DRAFT_108091 [Epithele typhae]KAH9911326.1 hypothetical protein BXZ73DRAFT_108091 [Epithele typhae]